MITPEDYKPEFELIEAKFMEEYHEKYGIDHGQHSARFLLEKIILQQIEIEKLKEKLNEHIKN